MAAYTVNPLLISKSMPLLRLVPLNDQTVTESQRRTGISSTINSSVPFQLSRHADPTGNEQFIAIEERSRQSGLDVPHGLRLELLFGLEFLRGLVRFTIIVSMPCVIAGR